MRLINAKSLELREFMTTRKTPKYAILSHRWEDDEVSFLDMQNLQTAKSKKGFIKIRLSCRRAIKDGYEYLWCDTCCINKDSSAELSEAINSMFRWYQRAAVCYAYLSDVSCTADSDSSREEIEMSEWFSRGWTLQELLAPLRVEFFNRDWNCLGTKRSLGELIVSRTGIDKGILTGREPVSNRSIAQRMSWASSRKTTRIEDEAYCLLGLFDINMPMLYGEEQKAFLRLQEEIIKNSDDQSIFTWNIERTNQPGLLADSPSAFACCQHISVALSKEGRLPFSMTNRGLSIRLFAQPVALDTYLVLLGCKTLDPKSPYFYNSSFDGPCLGIYLRRLDEDDQYARVIHNDKTVVDINQLPRYSQLDGRYINVYVRQAIRDLKAFQDRIYGFHIRRLEDSGGRSIRWDAWGHKQRPVIERSSFTAFDFSKNLMVIGTLPVAGSQSKVFAIKLGFDFEFNPVCYMATKRGHQSLHDSGISVDESQTRETSEAIQAKLYPYPDFGIPELADHPGVWAFKVDRVKGINTHISGRVDATVKIYRGQFEGQIIWAFEYRELATKYLVSAA